MWRLRGRRIGLAIILVAAALGLFLASRLLIGKGLDFAAKSSEIAAFLLAIAGLIVAPFGRITRWARGPQPPTPEEIDRARINLHAALSGAWSEEGSEVYEDVPMRVRFSVAAEESQAGDFDSVAESFSHAPRYRRVVLGEAGAGKTVLVTELQRSLVETPQRGDPLPVIVPAAAWRPDRQSLLDWLAKQLADDYGWLPAAHARALVARGLVLPILDGLDEMPGPLRPDAIARINKYHVYRPLIVTSRESEYRDAVGQTRAGIKASAVVAVEPLHLADTTAYLDAAGGDRWAKVLGGMGAHGDSALARVLANPLMLWLARVEYEDKSPDQLALFGSRDSLEDFLLGQLVPSVYADDPSQGAAGQFGCTAQQARRWLGNLASDIYRQYSASRSAHENEREVKEEEHGATISGAPVLAWWEIGNLAGRWRRLGIALRAAVLCGVALPLGIWVLEQYGNWQDGTYRGPVNVGHLFLSGPVGRLIRPTAQALLGFAQKHNNGDVGDGYLYSVYKFFLPAIREIVSQPFLMILIAAFSVIIFAANSRLGASRVPARLQLNAKAIFNVLLMYGIIFITITAAVSSMLLLAHWPVHPSVFFSSRSTWVSLLTLSLLGSIVLSDWGLTSRSDASGNLSPEESLRLDRRADIVVSLTGRSTFTAGVWLICGRPVAVAYAIYAITAMVLALALGGQNRFASRSYVDARNWLAAQGKIPWRTMTFLADASRRGVLRQVGAAYQFRHIRLLEQVRYWRSDGQGWPEREQGRLGYLRDKARAAVPWRREETLEALIKEAKRHRRTARAGLDVIPPGFPAALDGLAGRLRRWSDERARAALAEVLASYRIVAETDPAAFGPGLAQVLRESASALGPDEALRVSQEAVSCYLQLAPIDPRGLAPALAEAASDLAGWLRERPAEPGRAVLAEALDFYRTRAETDPAVFRPGLAQLLKVSASALRWDKALGVSQEAVSCYRELAQADPAGFVPALAEAVSELAWRLSRLGRADQALALTGGMIEALSRPAEAFRPALARSLSDLGDWLRISTGSAEESASARREAAAGYRELAEADPDRYGRRCASSLYTLAASYRTLRRQPDELAAIRGAVDACRERVARIVEVRRQLAEQEDVVAACEQLAETQPAEFLPDLADAVQGLANELACVHQPRVVRILADETDRIRSRYRRSADIPPRQAREMPLLSRVDALALWLWKLGENAEALAAAQLSLDLAPVRRAALRRRRTRLREELQVRGRQNRVRSLTRKVESLRLAATRDAAAQKSLLQARRDLAAALEDQSDVLDTLAFRRRASDRYQAAATATRQAIRAQEKAVGVYRQTYRKPQAGHRSQLAGPLAAALDTLALRLGAAGRSEEAVTAASEASKIRQRDQAAIH